MKRILTVILLLAALNLPAATVRYATTNFATGYLTNRLKVTPVSAPFADGNTLVAGLPVWVTTTNGLGTNVLNGGNYSLTMQGYTNRTIYFAVPSADTNIYDLTTLISSGANFFNYRPTVQVLGGSNITVTPSSGLGPFTVSATGLAPLASPYFTGTNHFTNAASASDNQMWVDNLGVIRIGNETSQVHIQGSDISGTSFTGTLIGNGTLITGIPESGVTSLTADLSARNLKANNGSDFASPLLTASNISIITLSNQTQLPTRIDLSSITGKYPGQMLVTYGGGNGGGGIHQVYFWNTNGGVANWNGGMNVPGQLTAYSDSAPDNHLLIVSNGVDNVLELRNNDPTHYSAVRFTDKNGNEKGAIGYGNTSAPFYPGINYFEDYGTSQGVYIVGSGKLYWGEEATTGDLVRYATGTTNAAAINVVFRVTGTGAIQSSGASTLNSLTVSNNATLGATAGAVLALAGTSITIGNGGTANTGLISGGKLKINTSGTAFDVCNAQLTFNDGGSQIVSSGGSFGGGKLTIGFCATTVRTNMVWDQSTETTWANNGMTISATPATPAAGVILDLTSTTRALLLPRMTKTQRNAISGQVAGMAVYQTDNTPGLRVYNGVNWIKYTEATD